MGILQTDGEIAVRDPATLQCELLEHPHCRWEGKGMLWHTGQHNSLHANKTHIPNSKAKDSIGLRVPEVKMMHLGFFACRLRMAVPAKKHQ